MMQDEKKKEEVVHRRQKMKIDGQDEDGRTHAWVIIVQIPERVPWKIFEESV